MKSMNKVLLIGYLGANPELQISKSGKPYCRLSLATHRSRQNVEEKWETVTDWHSVFVWGPLAERCCHNMQKGALLLVEGALTYWQAAQQDKYKNAIHGFEVKLLASSTKSVAISPESMIEEPPGSEDLDNSETSRNHNAVAHPA